MINLLLSSSAAWGLGQLAGSQPIGGAHTGTSMPRDEEVRGWFDLQYVFVGTLQTLCINIGDYGARYKSISLPPL